MKSYRVTIREHTESVVTVEVPDELAPFDDTEDWREVLDAALDQRTVFHERWAEIENVDIEEVERR